VREYLKNLTTGITGFLGGKLFICGLVLISGFTSLSGDEAGRVLLANAWAEDPSLLKLKFTEGLVWLPVPIWLMGGLLMIWKDLWLIPMAVNIFFSLVGLYYIFRLGEALNDYQTGLLSAALFGINPWNTWLSLSAAVEPIFHGFLLSGIYYFVRWQQTEKRCHLWFTAISLFFACTIRPEAWVFTGFCSLWILIRPFSKNKRIGFIERSLAAVFSLGFCFTWLGINYVDYGNPLNFLSHNLEYVSASGQLESVILRLLQFPLFLFLLSPFMTISGIWALPWAWKRQNIEGKAYLSMIVGVFCLFTLVWGTGVGTAHSPQRFVLIFYALISPFVASRILHVLRKNNIFSALITYGLIIFFIGNFTFNFFYVDRYEYTVKAGRYLNKLRNENYLQEFDCVLTEFGLHHLDGTFKALSFQTRDFLVSESQLLQVFSGYPEIFLDRESTQNCTALSQNTIFSALNEECLKLLVFLSPDIVHKLPNQYRLFCQIGPYLFFGKKGFVPPCDDVTYPQPMGSKVKQSIGNYHIKGYTLHPWILPRSVFIWLDPISSDASKTKVLVRAEGKEGTFQEILPIHVIQSEALLVFPLQLELPAGRYTLSLSSVFDANSEIFDFEELNQAEITLGPITLIESKRMAARTLLKGRHFQPDILFRLLLTF
jgi:hypothetical protein